jgi:hypothetical protein
LIKMPRLDNTGPYGNGPLTGRGMGPCGCGMRRGAGRCFGRDAGYRASALTSTISKDEEKRILEAELRQIDFEKQEIEKRLNEI